MDQFNIKKAPNNEFFRTPNQEDMRYRRIQKATFAEKLEKILPKTSTLCFHGTTIWNAEEIIKSGTISAEIDRKGMGEDVLDSPGKISVTTIENLWFTVKQFADLANFSYPAGCIFVIEPKNAEEIQSSKDKNLIDNVDFITQPHRLKAIITTPENIDRITNWIKKSEIKLDKEVVVDFDQYLANAQKEYVKDAENTL